MTVRFIRFGVDAPANEELDTCIRRYSCSITRSFVLGSRTCETMGKRVHESFPTRGRGNIIFSTRSIFDSLEPTTAYLLASFPTNRNWIIFFSPLKSALIIFVLSFFFFLSPLSPSRRCLDRFEKNRAKSLWSRNHFLIARRKWFESNHWICAWNASKQDWIDTWRDTLFESFRRNRGTDYRTRKSDAGGDASTPTGHIKQYITDFIFHEQQTWTTVKQKLKV